MMKLLMTDIDIIRMAKEASGDDWFYDIHERSE